MHQPRLIRLALAPIVAALLSVTATFALSDAPATQPEMTPAQLKIQRATLVLKQSPQLAESYGALAEAFCQRHLESADPLQLDEAEQAVVTGSKLSPPSFLLQRMAVRLLVQRGEYEKARTRATELNKQVPDELSLYGWIADADIAMGDYEHAEKLVQQMLDLRPANVDALIHGAQLRAIFGDPEGAIEFYTAAVRASNSTEPDHQARLLSRLAELQLRTGNVEAAEESARQAIDVFPKSPEGALALAEVLTAQNKPADAVAALRGVSDRASQPKSMFKLALAADRAAMPDQAAAARKEFHTRAAAGKDRPDNANRELILYYVDDANDPAAALSLARQEFARRQDVLTRDAYAWALLANGDAAEARRQIDAALLVGYRDAAVLYHAGAIAKKSHDDTAAAKFWKQAIEFPPSLELRPAARAEMTAAIARMPVEAGP